MLRCTASPSRSMCTLLHRCGSKGHGASSCSTHRAESKVPVAHVILQPQPAGCSGTHSHSTMPESSSVFLAVQLGLGGLRKQADRQRQAAAWQQACRSTRLEEQGRPGLQLSRD